MQFLFPSLHAEAMKKETHPYSRLAFIRILLLPGLAGVSLNLLH